MTQADKYSRVTFARSSGIGEGFHLTKACRLWLQPRLLRLYVGAETCEARQKPRKLLWLTSESSDIGSDEGLIRANGSAVSARCRLYGDAKALRSRLADVD